MRKAKKMKFLSESVLLEESGLPHMNLLITLTIIVVIVLFIFWSNQIELVESFNFSGRIIEENSDGTYVAAATISPSNINDVQEEAAVTLSISGITDKQSISGYISEVDWNLITNDGQAYYYCEVVFESDDIGNANLRLEGMDVRINKETGSLTLMQYLLGSIYESSKEALNLQQ